MEARTKDAVAVSRGPNLKAAQTSGGTAMKSIG
jgi:hypothetical protein